MKHADRAASPTGRHGEDNNARAPRPAAGWHRASLLAVGLCFLINAVDGMNVLLMSYLAPSVAADWHLSPTTLGELFSAGLCGMAIGGLFLAPLGDRYGRRPLILFSLITMSTGMILSGYTTGVAGLLLARVIVGIGIGTVLACMTALVAEFAPPHRRNFAIGLLQGGYPIGATITGFVTAWALPSHTWHTVLQVSGYSSLLLFPFVFMLLPESTSFLSRASSPQQPETKTVLSTLLGKQLRHDTLLLWTAIFFGFMVLYSIVSWIPKLAIDAGLNPRAAIYAGAIYNAGAFTGTVGLAWLADAAHLKRLIAAFLLTAAALLIVFGGVPMPVAALLMTAFAIGATLQGGFNGLYPLSTCVYAVEVRSAGLGWAMGIGRAGAVIGPMLSGYILSLHGPLVVLFVTLAAPLVLASLSAAAIHQTTQTS